LSEAINGLLDVVHELPQALTKYNIRDIH